MNSEAFVQLKYPLDSKIMDGMGDFRVIADDTWVRLLALHAHPSGNSAAPPTFASLFARHKRSVWSTCNCSERNHGCPSGPPGPPGNSASFFILRSRITQFRGKR